MRRYFAGSTTLVDVESGREIKVDAYDGCGNFVSSREDGSFVVSGSKGLEWFGPDGSSLGVTPGGVPCSEAGPERSRWSPDGRFLAVWAHIDKGDDLGEIGVLDWTNRKFTPITPNGYYQTGYGWQGKHTLLIAGHTNDVDDYRIDAVDAESLQRKKLRDTRSEARFLASSPDGTVITAYESGLIEALSLDGKQVVWTGRHSGLDKLVAGSSLLLTNSIGQLRQWPVHPGAANWVFRSTPDHAYLVTAGEPGYTWLAATLKIGTELSVEVRSARTGDTFKLPFPQGHDRCGVTVFSRDGRWLVTTCKDAFVLFDSHDWKAQPLLFSASMKYNWQNIRTDKDRILITDGDQQDAYEFDVSGEKPRLTRRSDPQTLDLTFFPPCRVPLGVAHANTRERKEGWEPLLPLGPAATQMTECAGSGWIQFRVIRGGGGTNSGTSDTEMVPSDLQKLREFFDRTLPRLSDSDLRALIDRRPVTSAR